MKQESNIKITLFTLFDKDVNQKQQVNKHQRFVKQSVREHIGVTATKGHVKNSDPRMIKRGPYILFVFMLAL